MRSVLLHLVHAFLCSTLLSNSCDRGKLNGAGAVTRTISPRNRNKRASDKRSMHFHELAVYIDIHTQPGQGRCGLSRQYDIMAACALKTMTTINESRFLLRLPASCYYAFDILSVSGQQLLVCIYIRYIQKYTENRPHAK